LSIKRAGADAILTYFAKSVGHWLAANQAAPAVKG